ncbi:MAG: hypothetical protein K8H85_07445, partial [Cyclobacteriaceae bacterium]|nr:hypothetical protein [Cyclobacteriaceae bacterium]
DRNSLEFTNGMNNLEKNIFTHKGYNLFNFQYWSTSTQTMESVLELLQRWLEFASAFHCMDIHFIIANPYNLLGPRNINKPHPNWRLLSKIKAYAKNHRATFHFIQSKSSLDYDLNTKLKRCLLIQSNSVMIVRVEGQKQYFSFKAPLLSIGA